MEDIIASLIQIEEQADDTVKKMAMEREALPARIREETARCAAEIERKTDADIDELRRRSDAACAEKIQKIKQDSEQKFEAIKTAFAQHHAIWRKALFDKVVGT